MEIMTKIQSDDKIAHRQVEQALQAWRMQEGVIIRDKTGQALAYYPAEFLDEPLLSALRSPQARLLVTAVRAQHLGLEARHSRIDMANLSLAELRALSDPLAAQPPGAAHHVQPTTEADGMALRLAKQAALLPALLLAPPDQAPAHWPTISTDDIARYLDHIPADVTETARASLPVEGAENATLISFRDRFGGGVHLALVVGDATRQASPLTRVHSSCVTGDILGSLRCDCGDQLKLAMAQITAQGSGVLVYLHQEGRGIGITNKLRAYRLQEQGIDTYEANRLLGFEEDERDFMLAAAILKKLSIVRVRLLSNNPHKIAAMEKAGITVAERVPIVAPSGKHNHGYLDAKAKKAGHVF